MRIDEIQFTKSGTLEKFIILTAAATNNPQWLVNYLAAKNEAEIIPLSVLSTSIPSPKNNNFVILTGLELPILAESISLRTALSGIESLRKKCANVCICLIISEALVNEETSNGATYNTLVKSLFYEAQLILQLQPLPTGRAKDVTGRLVIAKGPKNQQQILAKDLSYFVNRKGVVDLFTV